MNIDPLHLPPPPVLELPGPQAPSLTQAQGAGVRGQGPGISSSRCLGRAGHATPDLCPELQRDKEFGSLLGGFHPGAVWRGG